MTEPFDFMKLIKSPFTGLYWVKSVMLGLGIFALLITVYAYYKAFIKKPLPATTQNAEQITNYNYTLRQTFGCSRFPIKVDKQ